MTLDELIGAQDPIEYLTSSLAAAGIGEPGLDCDGDPDPSKVGKVWITNGSAYWRSGDVLPRIESGVYMIDESQSLGVYLRPLPAYDSETLVLPDPTTDALQDGFKRFWALRDEFTARGLLQKRGLLLWGPPGSGKSSCIRLFSQYAAQNDTIVLIAEDPNELKTILLDIRAIEPERRLMVILEDFEAMVNDRPSWEATYLSILDGEPQIDRVMFIATSNYPERLDKRFTDRPSRFDLIQEVGMPAAITRRAYLEQREPQLRGDDLEHWVKATEGLGLAHLRELVVSVYVFGYDFKVSLKRLKDGHDFGVSSENSKSDKRKVGFKTDPDW